MKLQHIKYRNQGTDWLDVCSMQCPLCALHTGLRSLQTLAHNLAIAAGLCAAFADGHLFGVVLERANGIDEERVWYPGCRRSTP